MKKSIFAILAIAFLVIAGYYYFTRVQNPEIRWDVYPGYTENTDGVYGPRDQRYRPGGGSSHPDDGMDNEGRSTGLVIFGPIDNGGMGHEDSRATAEFVCGDGSACTITVRISGSIVGGSSVSGEQIKLKAQRLSSSGLPMGNASVITPHTSDSGTKEYTLTLNGCGNVRLTAEFEETISASNPAGIQNKFSVQITNYSCS
jgi:hypothetical protein